MNTLRTTSPIDRLRDNPESPLAIRDFRRMVAQTASLVSTDGPIREEMAESWVANMETRTIGWRTTLPWPPSDVITEDEMLVLVAHEAGHLRFSGLHTFADGMTNEDKVRFHRFVNAVEDIRIERMLGKEFGGFWHRAQAFVQKCYGFLAPTADELHAVDQVGLTWVLVEKGAKGIGDPRWIEWARANWARVDTMIANADSTSDLADAVYPVYLELMDEVNKPKEEEQKDDEQQGDAGDEQEQDDDGESGDGSSSASGAGAPGGESGEAGEQGESNDGGAGDESGDIEGKGATDTPVRSDGEAGTGPMSPEEQMKGMREDAEGDAKDALDTAVQEEQGEKHDARKQKEKVQASADGRSSKGHHFSVDESNLDWQNHAHMNRPQINLLTSRLRSVLRTNAMDNWQGGQKRGRLDTKRAYKASAGNPRIFKQRKAVGSLDYTFGILVDCSASMRGAKSTGALDGTVIVAEALDKVGLNSFIVPWQTIPGVIKRVGDQLTDRVRGFIGSQISGVAGGTIEVSALIVAQEELRKVGGHRVLFTISDGDTVNKDESARVIRELTNEGVICVSIGVGFPAPAHHPRQISVKDGAELAAVLPRLIAEYVKRGA